MAETARRGFVRMPKKARKGLPTITEPVRSSPMARIGKIAKDPGNSQIVIRNGVNLTTSLSLIERVKQGEPDSWGRLWYLYRPLVRSQCRRHGLSEMDSEDIEQDVFKTVVLKIMGFEKRPGPSFRCWLRRITQNKLGDHFRRTRIRREGLAGRMLNNTSIRSPKRPVKLAWGWRPIGTILPTGVSCSAKPSDWSVPISSHEAGRQSGELSSRTNARPMWPPNTA